MPKLTEAEVIIIMGLYHDRTAKRSADGIGRMYGVSPTTILNVIDGKGAYKDRPKYSTIKPTTITRSRNIWDAVVFALRDVAADISIKADDHSSDVMERMRANADRFSDIAEALETELNA